MKFQILGKSSSQPFSERSENKLVPLSKAWLLCLVKVYMTQLSWLSLLTTSQPLGQNHQKQRDNESTANMQIVHQKSLVWRISFLVNLFLSQ